MRITTIMALVIAFGCVSVAGAADSTLRSLDGSGNNVRHPDWGQANTPYTRVAPPNYADGVGAGRRATHALRQQPDLQRHRTEPVLRERRDAVGVGLGAVPRPHLRAAARVGGESAPHRVRRRTTRSRSSRNDFGAIAFDRTPAAPGTGTSPIPAPADQHRQLATSTPRASTATTRPAGVAARRPGRRQPRRTTAPRLLLPSGYLPRRRRPGQRRDRTGDGAHGTPAGQPRRAPWSPATFAPTRTSR